MIYAALVCQPPESGSWHTESGSCFHRLMLHGLMLHRLMRHRLMLHGLMLHRLMLHYWRNPECLQLFGRKLESLPILESERVFAWVHPLGILEKSGGSSAKSSAKVVLQKGYDLKTWISELNFRIEIKVSSKAGLNCGEFSISFTAEIRILFSKFYLVNIITLTGKMYGLIWMICTLPTRTSFFSFARLQKSPNHSRES